MKKRLVALLCLSVMVSLLLLGILSFYPGDRDSASPAGTRVTLVSPSGERDGPPSPGSEIW